VSGHLDDPAGFTPDEAFRSRVVSRGRQLRRRRRFVGAVATLAVVLLAGLGGMVGVAAWRWHQVDRVTIHAADEAGGAGTGVTEPLPGDGGDGTDAAGDLAPMTLLLVGSDERHGSEAALVEGRRADTIALVRIDPVALDAYVLSIPRDLWVPIAGTDRIGRVNSALGIGPAALVATVEQFTGTRVDHYVELGFEGFRELVDLAGGIDVAFAHPARDRHTGLLVERAGCVHLDGEAALAYVRSRHYEELVDGRWRLDPRSDLGRIERQQQFGRAALAALSGLGSGPRDLDGLTRLLADHATIDDELDLGTLRSLVGFARALDPADVTTEVVPATPAVVGGASVLLPAPTTTAPPSSRAGGEVAEQGGPGEAGAAPAATAACA